MGSVRFLAVFFSIIFFFSLGVPAQACTLFSAAGDQWVEGGGTLIAKTRDASPAQQWLKLISPEGGYRYYGVDIDDNVNGRLRGGINEKGLAIVCASASSVEQKTLAVARKNRFKSNFGVTDEHIISTCATVDEALKVDKKVWAGPQTIILADKNEVAIVEIGPDGNISVKRTANGTFHHANHYVHEDMLWANGRDLPGSVVRHERAGQLIASVARPISMNDFVAFCHDKNAGATDSIWREGIGNSSQTLAAIVFHMPKQGNAVMYFKIRENPADKGNEKVYRLTADDVFKK